MTTLAIAIAGGLGAWVRAEIGWAAARLGAPRAGTHLVNLLGAAALGLLTGATAAGPGATARDVIGVGFLGGFTTFSTWMVQATDEGIVTAVRRTVPLLAAGILAAAAGHGLVGVL